jgi:hypothetical protein
LGSRIEKVVKKPAGFSVEGILKEAAIRSVVHLVGISLWRLAEEN